MSSETKPIPTDADKPHNCPYCKTSLLGKPIPNEYKEHYFGNYYKREIGVEMPEKYDGVYFWVCPDCSGEWGGYRSLKK